MALSRLREEYTIGWICAVPIERAAAVAILDEEHEELPSLDHDDNKYSFGRIGNHNVVIGCLPAGVYGTVSAANVAVKMRSSFPALRFGLMVGIGGAAPSETNDVRLGDVVVSQPGNGTGGVIQYDFGKRTAEGKLLPTGFLNAPPMVLLNASASIQSKNPANLGKTLTDIINKAGDIDDRFFYPEIEDRLFVAEYTHVPSTGRRSNTCAACDASKTVPRHERKNDFPYIHYGIIASGNQVMKDASTRDKISKETGAICFEMEAAGLMNDFPCLVARGICDYSDSHKNKAWQPYAAIAAAAYTKEFLCQVPIVQYNRKDENQGTDREETKCLQILASVARDPQIDKRQIERRKDRLIHGSYQWIMETDGFKDWISNGNRVLRITGDPGKGKTMIMIGLINELTMDAALPYDTLESRLSKSAHISYFFCQATDEGSNNATSVLKGILLYLLGNDLKLLKFLRKQHELRGESLKTQLDFNLLETIFLDIVADPACPSLYLMVDALDECTHDLRDLLIFICRSAEMSPKVKWLLSSRHSDQIRSIFARHNNQSEISLEDHREAIEFAIQNYIDYKVTELDSHKSYRSEDRKEIEMVLREKCGGTFLWVHLACKELEDSDGLSCEAVSILQDMPKELTHIYTRMLDQINDMKSTKTSARCLDILIVVATAYRPLKLLEMSGLARIGTDHLPDLERLVNLCGSFLTIQDGDVFFVHQSAKDFLANSILLRSTITANGHKMILLACLELFSKSLRSKNLLGLSKPSQTAHELSDEQKKPVFTLNYACCYWLRHVGAISEIPGDESLHIKLNVDIKIFFHESFLYWLEALSIFEKLSEGLLQLQALQGSNLFNPDFRLEDMVVDAVKFIRHSFAIIEAYPLQVYTSALLFSPENSIIRQKFIHLIPDWLAVRRNTGYNKDWGCCQQVMFDPEVRQPYAYGVAWSPDGKWIASSGASFSADIKKYNGCLRLWDSKTGQNRRMISLELELSHKLLCFSADSKYVAASLKGDLEIGTWEVATGRQVRLIEISMPTGEEVGCFAFSSDWKYLGLVDAKSCRAWILDGYTGNCIESFTVAGLGSLRINAITFSVNRRLLGFSKGYVSPRLCDMETGDVVLDFESNLGISGMGDSHGCAVSFAPNGHLLAFSFEEFSETEDEDGFFIDVVKLWDIRARKVTGLFGHSRGIISLSFSHDSSLLASGSLDKTVRLWECQTGRCLNVFGGHTGEVRSLAFSPDDSLIASLSDEGIIRLWDAKAQSEPGQSVQYDPSQVTKIVSSPDGNIVAAIGNQSSKICLWDPMEGVCTQTLRSDGRRILNIRFFRNSKSLLTVSDENAFQIWDVHTGDCIRKIAADCLLVELNVIFDLSPDDDWIALPSRSSIKIWNTRFEDSAPHLLHLVPDLENSYVITTLKFTSDGQMLASVSADKSISLWNIRKGTCVSRFPIKLRVRNEIPFSPPFGQISFSPDGKLIACLTEYNTITLFDHTSELWNAPYYEPKLEEAVMHIKQDNFEEITALKFSPDSKVIAAIFSRKVIRFWDTKSGDLLRTHNIYVRCGSISEQRIGLKRPCIRFSEISDFYVCSYFGEEVVVPYDGHFYDDAEGECCQGLRHADLMDVENDRILIGLHNFLVLHVDYNVTAMTYTDRMIVIGTESGRLYFLEIKPESGVISETLTRASDEF